MTANIPSSIFNVLVAAFFLIVIIGVAIGAYAATIMKKNEVGTSKVD